MCSETGLWVSRASEVVLKHDWKQQIIKLRKGEWQSVCLNSFPCAHRLTVRGWTYRHCLIDLVSWLFVLPHTSPKNISDVYVIYTSSLADPSKATMRNLVAKSITTEWSSFWATLIKWTLLHGFWGSWSRIPLGPTGKKTIERGGTE